MCAFVGIVLIAKLKVWVFITYAKEWMSECMLCVLEIKRMKKQRGNHEIEARLVWVNE